MATKQSATPRGNGHHAPRDYDKLPDIARISVPEVAMLAGNSRATVWVWIKKGKLPKPTCVPEGSRPSLPFGPVRKLLVAVECALKNAKADG